MDPDLDAELVGRCSEEAAATYLETSNVAPATSLCGCSSVLLASKLELGRLCGIMLRTIVEVFTEESGSPVDGGLENQISFEQSWVDYKLTVAIGKYP